MKKAILFVLILLGGTFAAQDSITVDTTFFVHNWKRAVTGFERDTTNNRVFIQLNSWDMQSVRRDTVNGITFNVFGVDNVWTRNQMRNDSATIGGVKITMWALYDTISVHAGKEMKKRAK